MPDFRFVIGALLAVVVLGVTSFGLLAAVQLTHLPKVGPLETARSGFDERAEWNQFTDADSARRFDDLARRADAALTAAERAVARPAKATEPVVPSDAIEQSAAERRLDVTPVAVVAAERAAIVTANAVKPVAAADAVMPDRDVRADLTPQVTPQAAAPVAPRETPADAG